jgi:hypothetical protein
LEAEAYITSRLNEGEKALHFGRVHWVILLGPALVIFVGGASIENKGISAAILLCVGVLFAIFAILSYKGSLVALTQRRILGRMGFPFRRGYDIELEKIADMTITQPALGKFLNFGRVIVAVQGSRSASMRMISDPIGFVAAVQKQVDVLREELAARAREVPPPAKP